MNRVNVTGRLTKNVENRVTTNGTQAATFSLAVNSNSYDKEGKCKTYFPNFKAFGNIAKVLVNYTEKGSLVAIEGELTTRDYEDKDGKKVYVTEILVSKVDLLGGKKEINQNPNTNSSVESSTATAEDPYKKFGEELVLNESELPF